MIPLILGPAELSRLHLVRAHAEANPIGLAELRRRAEAREPVMDPANRCEMPFGFRIAFTVEEHPAGWARHLSVSVPTPGRLPNSEAMRMIGRELGMRMDLFDPVTRTYFEPEDGPPFAVNVVEPILETFTCEICDRVFPEFEGDRERATLEGAATGTLREPCGLVCDECFKLTPWGSPPGVN